MTGSPVLRRYAADVDEAHGELTRLDQLSGDGDFGDNLRDGMRRVIAELDRAGTGGHGFDVAGRVFLDDVGGTSGPLFGLLFILLVGVTLWQGAGQSIRLARMTRRFPLDEAPDAYDAARKTSENIKVHIENRNSR